LSGHYRNTGFYPKYSLVLTQKFTVLNTLTRFSLEPIAVNGVSYFNLSYKTFTIYFLVKLTVAEAQAF